MNIDQFEHALKAMAPPPEVYKEQSGMSTWINVCFKEKTFSVELIQGDEVGVSELDLSQPFHWFEHDKVFENFELVLEFIKKKLA